MHLWCTLYAPPRPRHRQPLLLTCLACLFVVGTISDEATDEDEYTVQEGDEIIVHRQDPDGWWLASRIVDARLGYLPSTYLTPLATVIKNGQTGKTVNFLDYARLPRFNSIRV